MSIYDRDDVVRVCTWAAWPESAHDGDRLYDITFDTWRRYNAATDEWLPEPPRAGIPTRRPETMGGT